MRSYKEKILFYHQHWLRKLEDDRKTEEQKEYDKISMAFAEPEPGAVPAVLSEEQKLERKKEFEKVLYDKRAVRLMSIE